MRRGPSPHAAGQSTPGIPSTLAPTYPRAAHSAASHVKAGLQSALTGQVFRLAYPISNRNWMRLEIAVTPTKHSPEPISNRNKNTLVRIAWGSQFWLRNRSARPAHQRRLPTGRPARRLIEVFLGEEL